MHTPVPPHTHLLIISMLIFTFALNSCSSRTEQLQDAVAPTSVREPVAAPADTQAPAATETTNTDQATIIPATPEPTTTPLPQREALVLGESGFGQDGRQAGFAFFITNPNTAYAVTSTDYQVAFYDDAGTVIETDSSNIELLLPGQTLGIAGTMFLDEGVTVAKVDVQVNDGSFEPSDPIPTFSVDRVAYLADQILPRVVGVIASPYNWDVSNVRVAAVAYDEAGAIIGGGFTYVNFIPADSETAVSLSLTTSVIPDKVELYPAISGLTMLSDESRDEAVEPLRLEASGYGQDDSQVGYGLLVKNPSPGHAIENSQYRAAVFAEDGSVLGVDEGYIKLVLPDQTLGIGATLGVPEGANVTKIVVQVKSGVAQETEALPFFTSENASFKPNDYFPSVTGIVKSPYGKDVKNLRVSALAYNAESEIIGGGFTFVDFVPSNGQAAVDVSIRLAGTPAQVELYPALSGLSFFENE